MGEILVTDLVIRDGGNVARTITAIQMRDGTNTPRDISEIRVRDSNNVSRIVFTTAPSMSLEITPASVGGVVFGSGTITTDAATAVPTGGVPPYTYLWAVSSYTADVPPTIGSDTSAVTTFTQTGVVFIETADFECQATDSVGTIAVAEITAAFGNVIP